jgi:hypothetical protein
MHDGSHWASISWVFAVAMQIGLITSGIGVPRGT